MKNFKKVISVVMALAMVISSFTAVSASKFVDVADTANYAEAVEVLEALGVVNGAPQENGTLAFEPEKSVTRAEAATMIVGALNMADDANAAAGTSQFADVNSQAAWAAGYVNVGVAQGFIAGYDSTSFGPLDNVTYAQMCVMLTQITGYGEYAKAYGGWPTGYTTMAASAGINKGVAVAQDAALTKGQVAMMIWNALQTPLLGVSEYAIDGNVYKPQNGKNNTEFKTLFAEKFDGYVVTAKIDSTPVIDESLDADEVAYTVVKADWWPLSETPVPATDASDLSQEATVAPSVDVNGNYMQTGKAVIIVDEDDQTSMVYFKATGKTETKELAADTYYLQSDLVDSKQFSTTHQKIRFGSTYYKFEAAIEVYVNGVYVETIAAEADDDEPTASQEKLDWILGNAVGTIKIMKNDPDPTDNDSVDYNTIFVDFYQVAEITSVDVDTDETVITLAGSKSLLSDETEIEEIVISADEVEEGKVTVTVTRNGEAATLDSLVNGDIIAYATDFEKVAENGTLTDPKVIDIIATNDEISGSVSSIDKNLPGANDNVYTIGGTDYTLIPAAVNPADPDDIDIKYSLDVRLDPFGRIYDYEANGASAKYAIALKVDERNDTLKLLLDDGTTKTYEVDAAKATLFADEFIDDINARTTPVQDRVVTYEVSGKNGKIIALAYANGDFVEDKEYKTRTGLLGSGNKILSTTPIINVEDNEVALTDAAKYTAFSKDDLLDGTKYTGYAYKVSPTNPTVVFVVITNVGTAFGEESRFAVAIDEPASVLTEEGDRVMSVKVLYNGEVQDMLFNADAANAIDVQDVFFFKTDSDGYVNEVFKAPFATSLDGKIDADEWSFNIWDDNTTIQLAKGIVTEVTSNAMSFATVAQVASGSLNTTYDLDDTHEDGIVTYGFAEDCVAYTYASNMQTRRETDKYDATSITSVKASNFASFDMEGGNRLNDGIYSESTEAGAPKMMDKATEATVMLVDGEIVAIFAIEK